MFDDDAADASRFDLTACRQSDSCLKMPIHGVHFDGKSGYRQFTTEIEIREGEAMPLNVSLLTTP